MDMRLVASIGSLVWASLMKEGEVNRRGRLTGGRWQWTLDRG